MDSALALVFLGVMAAAAVVQAALLVSLVMEWRELGSRLDKLERELPPRLARLGDVVDNLAQLTDAAVRQLPRVEAGLVRVRHAAGLVETLLKPLRPAMTALALWRGLKHGAIVYRKLRR